MEPVTIVGIVSAVGSLMTTSTRAAIGCKTLKEKYDDAPTALALLEDECRVTKAALTFIQDYLEANASTLSRRLSGPVNPFSDLIHVALTGSTTTFGMLEGEVQATYLSETVLDDYKGKKRTAVLWNENALVQISQRMSAVKGTLQLLLSVLSTESSQEIQRKLAEDADMVDSVRQTITDANPSSHEHEMTSIFTGTTGDDREFDFDAQIVTTKVYREALKFNQRRRRKPHAVAPPSPPQPEEYLEPQAEPQADPGPRHGITFASVTQAERNGFGHSISRSTTVKDQRRPSLAYSSDGGSDVNEQTTASKNTKRRSLSSRWSKYFPKRNSEPVVSGLKLSRSRSNEKPIPIPIVSKTKVFSSDVFRSTERQPLSIVLVGPNHCGKTFLRARMAIETIDGPASILYPLLRDQLGQLNDKEYTMALETSKLPVSLRAAHEHFALRIREVPDGSSLKNDDQMRSMVNEADAVVFCFNIKYRASFELMKTMAPDVSRLAHLDFVILNAMSYGAEMRDDAMSHTEIREASPCRKIVVCDATKNSMVLRLFHEAGSLALQARITKLQNGALSLG